MALQKTMEALVETDEKVLIERELNSLMEITLRLEYELSMIVESEQ